jgi:diguanylate cyclase (GGDEF)-like protein
VRLVITDNQMPGMDGFELVTEIRKTFSKEEVAVIGLSAVSGSSLSAKYLKRGANDFLVKPYSKEEFFCRVNQNIELLELVHEIKENSNRDYLTGLYNRRYFYDIGEKYFANAARNHLQLAVAMFDIDFFKVVNDTYGHAAGDLVIRRVAAAIAGDLRQTDLVARFGGEEFCVLAVNPGPETSELFERIRVRVAAMQIEYEGMEIRVSVSVGVVFGMCVTLADTLRRADELLYQAKQGGRNRVVCARAGTSGD